MVAAKLHEWTVDEFLAFEAKSDTRHQLIDGQIYDMAGGTIEHDIITGNVFARLHAQLRGKGCTAYTANMLVQTAAQLFYPDVTVICGDSTLVKRHGIDVLLNPTVMIEVLSVSTRHVDQVVKLRAYGASSSVRQVVLIEQDQPGIEVYTWDDERVRTSVYITDIDAVLELTAIGCTLALRDVYDKVTFESAQED
jgi:Uma2 family endonuclease